MREGIYWRGRNPGRRRQQEYNPNQRFVLPSGRQARERVARVLVFCLIFCFVSWTLSRFRTPASPISTERLPHQAPARAVVLELFRYYRHPQARNRSFTALAPEHRRRRGLLEESETTASSPQEILDEEEQEEQPFDGVQFVGENLTAGFDSLKKRRGFHESMVFDYDQEAPSSSRAGVGECPLVGGGRASELEIQSFFVKVALGYGTQLREYVLSIDTGSGSTWVNCEGRGPVALMGPNGLFRPRPDSFLNCKNDEILCKHLQEGKELPCDIENNFRCLFEYEYGDDTSVNGSVLVGDVRFDLSDGSRSQINNMAFGCADWVIDKETVDGVEEPISYDGLLGLGPHPASWLRQLNLLGIISEYVTAVCLEPVLGHMISREPGSSFLEHVGFISLGDLYTKQAASTAWTAIVPLESTDPGADDSMFSAMLVGFKYRDEVHMLEAEVEMGFDTGSDLTYFTTETFDLVKGILDEDALGMGYIETEDRAGRVDVKKRKCWHRRGSSSVRDFGELVMMFSSLTDDDTTSDLVIKPEYYITLGGRGGKQRTCFNIRVESEFNYGNIGGEAMRGHLLIFKEHESRQRDSIGLIGWSPVTSCKDLR